MSNAAVYKNIFLTNISSLSDIFSGSSEVADEKINFKNEKVKTQLYHCTPINYSLSTGKTTTNIDLFPDGLAEKSNICHIFMKAEETGSG